MTLIINNPPISSPLLGNLDTISKIIEKVFPGSNYVPEIIDSLILYRWYFKIRENLTMQIDYNSRDSKINIFSYMTFYNSRISGWDTKEYPIYNGEIPIDAKGCMDAYVIEFLITNHHNIGEQTAR